MLDDAINPFTADFLEPDPDLLKKEIVCQPAGAPPRYDSTVMSWPSLL